MARGKPTPGHKREQVKALKYLNPELSQRDIVRETGLAKTTIAGILADVTDTAEYEAHRERKKREHVVNALDIASAYIDHLKEPAVIAAAGARDSAIVAGTMIDKAQLLSGEPTAIVERQEPTPELVAELRVKLIHLRQLTGG